ncbi:hypothetical protein BGZ94_005543 [Podila epigama]|nr:hypothetical protein BGZ94_005543 [Podila epigama]
MSAEHDTVFHAKAPLKEGLQAASIGAGVGLLVSAVQNSVGSHSHGAAGVVARTGGTIGIFVNNTIVSRLILVDIQDWYQTNARSMRDINLATAMAGVFSATDAAVANVRQTKDAWNSVAAGCATGLVAGGFQRNAQTMVLGCVGMGAMMGAFDLSGNSLKGKYAEMSEQQKHEWRESQVNKQ